MLNSPEFRLINGLELDAVPARLYRARANSHARALARADWLLRDRSNGRFIATMQGSRIQFLHRSPAPQRRLDAVAEVLDAANGGISHLPLSGLDPLLAELGIDAEAYGRQSGLAIIAEPVQLEYAGRDCFRRPLWLSYDAAKAWTRMRSAAAAQDIRIQAISGYRSAHYQMGIFRRKIARGMTVNDILAVNAAPGFSEHHSGCAIDIGTPGEPAAMESFENTEAFAWLKGHAAAYGFRMSYPRGNAHGISYEPWHWFWIGGDQS
jgi:D-alanyl-D-alanine carboxypeptidase